MAAEAESYVQESASECLSNSAVNSNPAIQRVADQDEQKRLNKRFGEFVGRYLGKDAVNYLDRIRNIRSTIRDETKSLEDYENEKNNLLYDIKNKWLETKLRSSIDIKYQLFVKFFKERVLPKLDNIKLSGEQGIPAFEAAAESLVNTINKQRNILDITTVLHRKFWRENDLEPDQAKETELYSNLNEETVPDDKALQNKIIDFLILHCEKLFNHPLIQRVKEFDVTKNSYEILDAQLTLVRDDTMIQYIDFLDYFKDCFLLCSVEKTLEELNESSFKKNAKESKSIKQVYNDYESLKNKIIAANLLPPTDDLLKLDEFKFQKDLYNKDSNLELNYDNEVKEIKENFLKKVESIKNNNKEEPKKLTDDYKLKVLNKMRNCTANPNLSQEELLNGKNVLEDLKSAKDKLKKKIKQIYIQKLQTASGAPNHLYIDEAIIKNTAKVYFSNVISEIKVQTLIDNAMEKQYTINKEEWLKDILKFSDAANTSKLTTGDNCASLTSNNYKATHSTLYRANLPNSIDTRGRTKEELCNSVLGNVNHMCFHVSTNSFKIKGIDTAAHSYRRGSTLTYYTDIGANFASLSKVQLITELDNIKTSEVGNKENRIDTINKKHFHNVNKDKNKEIIDALKKIT